MKILQDFKNDLLSRREIKAVATAEKTPSKEEALKMVSVEFKTPEENIVVLGVGGKFGRDTFLISASIYDSKEAKEKIEPKLKKKKAAPGSEELVSEKK